MITAHDDAVSYAKAMQLGAADYLAKSIGFTLLKEKLLPLPKTE